MYSLLVIGCKTTTDTVNQPIDRYALVTRHNVVLSQPDTLGSLSVGNGEFAFTVDVSGLQSFPEEYENGISLGTQSQWGWHSFAGESYSLNDVAREYESCDGTKAPYAVQHSDGKAGAATRWLRVNPHRLHLGLVGLMLVKENGDKAALSDLKNIHQELNLWTGEIVSQYEVDGVPVAVHLFAHPEDDLISARIQSPLITSGRMKVTFRFPYGNECHVCPGYDWSHPEKHTTMEHSRSGSQVTLKRQLDSTSYYAHIGWSGEATFTSSQLHHFELTPQRTESFDFSVRFDTRETDNPPDGFEKTEENSRRQWEKFWREGAAIDFSGCTDPRANELERRVILSQYLTKIQCAGSLPPQETGLTMNSWYGKFHLEMHWWHGVHFPLWNRAHLLEKSMPWYSRVMEKAKTTATWQNYQGVRWQKMTDPNGNESPSSVGALLIWQQPHPIYYAELFYRQDSSRATLEKYKDIVFNTADFMASFARYNEHDKKYHLCHPLIPAQEIFKATETDDPPFELAYWHYALTLAQQWRERLGLLVEDKWQHITDHLAPLPIKDGLYLPTATTPDAYTDDQYRRDHPVVTGAYGCLPKVHTMDTTIMRRTFDEIMSKWQWETTWGWDYPMLAMTAARLGQPEKAIEALLMDVQKNTYLVNGHNYQGKRLRLYLPGNGGLLTAVAMMAAGWDGNTSENPGFPKNGKWNVRWEGLKVMP